MYTTIRSGPGHTPTFTCTVELAGRIFTGNPGKTKKQAQKNAAMVAWSELKQREYFLTFLPPSVSYYMILAYLLVDASGCINSIVFALINFVVLSCRFRSACFLTIQFFPNSASSR